MALSLTEYNTSAAAAIAAGSVAEVAGAFFTFASDETPTGWSSIATATTAYIALTASGTAGSQIVDTNYTSTAPTWRDDLQGWYASAASSVRIVASVYKAEATRYLDKRVLQFKYENSIQYHGKQIFLSSGTFVVPPSITTVYVTGCAAGGNGGSGRTSTSWYSGGGGGGGESIYIKPIQVSPGDYMAVTIGGVGSNTSFGSTSLNYGLNGQAASSSSAGLGGVGGALGSGSEAGGDGGRGSYGSGGSSGSSVSFSYGGTGNIGAGGGGGGGASIGMFAYYLSAGGLGGRFGGGGGGGNTGAGSATAGDGGTGGYGSGGGGGGTSYSGTGGSGASGGAGIIIVEW